MGKACSVSESRRLTRQKHFTGLLSELSSFEIRNSMSQLLHVHLLPALIEHDSLIGGTAVIIDILRASSTMTTALQNGASRVIPCGSTQEAFQRRDEAAPATVVLGGERGGVKIEGFDFGNSPAEYTSMSVGGRTVAFTTTNGTKALLAAASASEIMVGAFLNRRAIVNRLNRAHQSTHLICAGTDGSITGEDVLFAGAVVDGLVRLSALSQPVKSQPVESQPVESRPRWILNDCAEIAMSFWRQCIGQVAAQTTVSEHASLSVSIQATMKKTRGGRNLLSLGYDSDLALCSQLDTIDLVPVFQPTERCLLPEA